jgi:5-methylcytosine-specific restriction endonuclease McrA
VTTRDCQVMPKGYPLPQPSEPINPATFKLGSLCLRGHDWDGTGLSLRYAKPRGACVICARETALAKVRQRREQEPDYRAKQAAYIREKRARDGRYSRAKHSPEWHQARLGEVLIRRALERTGRMPSVAQLVHVEQLRYWRDNPQARREQARQAAMRRHAWRYMTDEAYRLYHRQKSKRRKATIRNSIGIQLTGKQVRARFAQFGHRCAYCGERGELHIEHVIPISQGGTHTLGNVIPACPACNFSKTTHEVEAWYRAQPFFTEQRWRKICRVLTWTGCSSVGQLALL